jgi:hypothetical protein
MKLEEIAAEEIADKANRPFAIGISREDSNRTEVLEPRRGIDVHVDSDCYGSEGVQFADWLEDKGFVVNRIVNVMGSDDTADLWVAYCKG